MQSLKEAFAAKLPGEIEKIKKLRKSVTRSLQTVSGLFAGILKYLFRLGSMARELWIK